MRIEERSDGHDKDIRRTRELDSSNIVRYNDIAKVNFDTTLTYSCFGIHGSGFSLHLPYDIRGKYPKKWPFSHLVRFGIVVFFKRVSEIRRFSNYLRIHRTKRKINAL